MSPRPWGREIQKDEAHLVGKRLVGPHVSQIDIGPESRLSPPVEVEVHEKDTINRLEIEHPRGTFLPLVGDGP